MITTVKNVTFYSRDVNDKWIAGATMTPAVAEKVRAVLKGRKRVAGKHYKFLVAKSK